jgi:hypothetical protein
VRLEAPRGTSTKTPSAEKARNGWRMPYQSQAALAAAASSTKKNNVETNFKLVPGNYPLPLDFVARFRRMRELRFRYAGLAPFQILL